MPLQITSTFGVSRLPRPLRTIEKLKVAGYAVLAPLPFILLLACLDRFSWHSLAPDIPGATDTSGILDYLESWALWLSWTPILLGWLAARAWAHVVITEPLTTTAYGTARWALFDDLRHANLVNSGRITLGLVERARRFRRSAWDFLSYPNDAHLISVAPPGAGKFRDLLATAIMLYPYSCIVIDPKGQAAAVTARGRREMGHEVVIVNPFDTHSERLGPSATYNPMENPDPRSPGFGADCDALADAIVVHAEHHTDPHFSDSARSLASGVIRYLNKYAPQPRMKNLAAVRSIIAGPPTILRSVCEAAIATGDRVISDKLARFAHITDGDRELRSIISTAITQTDFIGSEAIARNLAQSSFRFADLRRKPVTVYVVLPARYLDTCGKWFRLLVAGALHELISEKPAGNIPVLMVLDEFAQLGRMGAITTAMAIGRGYKLQVWPILQSLVQLRDLYGAGWESFMASADVRQFFAPRDHFTAAYISSMTGVTSVNTMSRNTAQVTPPQWQAGLTGESVHLANTQRPLMFPDEIMRLPDHQQLVFTQGQPPILAARMPYFSQQMGALRHGGRQLSTYFDPDPQHAA